MKKRLTYEEYEKQRRQNAKKKISKATNIYLTFFAFMILIITSAVTTWFFSALSLRMLKEVPEIAGFWFLLILGNFLVFGTVYYSYCNWFEKIKNE